METVKLFQLKQLLGEVEVEVKQINNKFVEFDTLKEKFEKIRNSVFQIKEIIDLGIKDTNLSDNNKHISKSL